MVIANTFQLSGHGTEIIYSTRSPDILASFSYKDPSFNVEALGDDKIKTEDSQLGTLVTVILAIGREGGGTKATLLIPSINLGPENDENESQPLTTLVIVSRLLDDVMLPVQSQLQEYTATTVTGTARHERRID
jgi:hypothetical protein